MAAGYQRPRRDLKLVEAAKAQIVPAAAITVSFAELLESCRQLRARELLPALRHRYIPIRHLSSEPMIAASDERSAQAATAAGFEISARARRRDMALALQQVFGQILICRTTRQLQQLHPAFSAHDAFGARQKTALLIALSLVLFPYAASPGFASVLLALIFSLIFLGGIAIRLWSVFNLAQWRERPRRPLDDEQLPYYSILVPMFGETKMLPRLLAALGALDYPKDRLDIKIILEEDDEEMRRAARRLNLPSQFEVLIVPRGSPQTKPRALTYALYFARGELITVFDAEDIPEPQQLRQAAEIFAAAPQSLACLQARLTFHDGNQNWLSRQFIIEYAALFDVVLPALGCNRFPIPLGGTSNHFRTDILRKVGAWDPYNVTEDADLGLRLARCGFEIDMFNSTTHEEANTSLANWMRQRRRWIKGWMQTGLVHLRSPKRLWEDLGAKRLCITLLMLGGMVVSPLVHPFLLAFAIAALISGAVPPEPDVAASAAAGFGAVVFVAGYKAAISNQLKGMSERGLRDLLPSIAGMPVYLLLISAAAWGAVWELIRRPHHWNKTEHGLSCFFASEEEMERAMGIEPTTSSLGSLRSTTELRPRSAKQ